MKDKIIRKALHARGVIAEYSGKYLPSSVKNMTVKLSGYPFDYPHLIPEIKLIVAFRYLLKQDKFVTNNPVKDRITFSNEMASVRREITEVKTVRDYQLTLQDGHQIKLRHYIPVGVEEKSPLLVFFHGGAFVVGDLDAYDEPCRIFSKYANVHVLSVDYRLAPEYPAPTAIHDCFEALQWAFNNADVLGVDTQKIAIGGDSAGGSLTAVVAQLANGTPYQPKVQLLIYPVVDAMGNYESLKAYNAGLVLGQSDFDNAFNYYVKPSGIRLDDFRISPIYGKLENLPKTLLVTAEYDMLRDEGELYAQKLKQAGNEVLSYRINGQTHGLLNLTGISPSSKKSVVKLAKELKQLLV